MPNDVLDVRGASVVVGTGVSPEGAEVPLRDVQRNLDTLYGEGRIRITPEQMGHRRSSFVGAVLATLPGTHTTAPPVWVVLDDPPSGVVADSAGGYPDPVTSAVIDEAGVKIALRAISEQFSG